MTLSVSRVIKASPRALYQAFLDPRAIAKWRPPTGMTARIFAFDAREGGGYRMAFDYAATDHSAQGKTSEHSDGFEGRFATLDPDRRIVEEIDFESDDPAFTGTMRLTTTFEPVAAGTMVTVLCENAPSGIKDSDHRVGIESSLANLAAFTE
ncbi:SRPBCC domain-containing protein [Reyranella sp.]|uniref:SRPBCC domain-containing protein n=1 Tax=Reyranella sp. TaxID=1929291 RepID=UPI001226CF31|nr:SRPBCC domain-containing protein [Reyranella sp.]TAJ90069.1 MAG: ATPase [Reyranella sp.]